MVTLLVEQSNGIDGRFSSMIYLYNFYIYIYVHLLSMVIFQEDDDEPFCAYEMPRVNPSFWPEYPWWMLSDEKNGDIHRLARGFNRKEPTQAMKLTSNIMGRDVWPTKKCARRVQQIHDTS